MKALTGLNSFGPGRLSSSTLCSGGLHPLGGSSTPPAVTTQNLWTMAMSPGEQNHSWLRTTVLTLTQVSRTKLKETFFFNKEDKLQMKNQLISTFHKSRSLTECGSQMLLECARINRHTSYPPQNHALWMSWRRKGAQQGPSRLSQMAGFPSFYG